MTDLKDLEKNYINSLRSQYLALLEILNEAKELQLDLEAKELTIHLIQRINVYYEVQNNIKRLLDKGYISAGADFFVESVMFYLKLLLKSRLAHLDVKSEVQVKRKRGAIRPDISIWDGDKVIAIIECKTQLGWDRGEWETKFHTRVEKLKSDFPQAEGYLLTMTDLNWKGFGQAVNVELIGKQYFNLLKQTWPGCISDSDMESKIDQPIELLFKSILELSGRN